MAKECEVVFLVCLLVPLLGFTTGPLPKVLVQHQQHPGTGAWNLRLRNPIYGVPACLDGQAVRVAWWEGSLYSLHAAHLLASAVASAGSAVCGGQSTRVAGSIVRQCRADCQQHL